MRLSSYNVENLFDRVKAMNLEDWDAGRPILNDFFHLNDLINQSEYTTAIKNDLIVTMKRYKGLLTTGKSKYIILREIRGKLTKKSGGQYLIRPDSPADWLGWFELVTEPVKHAATLNTGRIIDLLQTDVLCVIEAEDRPGLIKFNQMILPLVAAKPFRHVMLIDGNDERGIDVGILTKKGYDITRMLSHVDDTDSTGVIFSRDCAEYEIKTPKNNTILLLVNHFKSKGYGDPKASEKKRLRQTTRVRQIYDNYKNAGYKNIIILGDFNEVPDNYPLDPLLRDGSDLKDIFEHPKFIGDDKPGTHANGTKSGKLDYILLPPELWNKVNKCGIERRGVWGGQNGTLFPHLPEIKGPYDAASDHAALWVDLDM
jgi:endonuclease/exonuclease/phosphatase family metal-dependent hydrolase